MDTIELRPRLIGLHGLKVRLVIHNLLQSAIRVIGGPGVVRKYELGHLLEQFLLFEILLIEGFRFIELPFDERVCVERGEVHDVGEDIELLGGEVGFGGLEDCFVLEDLGSQGKELIVPDLNLFYQLF